MKADALRIRGIVEVVNRSNGYAILKDNIGTEYFALYREFTLRGEFDALDQGDAVEFEPFTDPNGKGNGLRAKRIRTVEVN